MTCFFNLIAVCVLHNIYRTPEDVERKRSKKKKCRFLTKIIFVLFSYSRSLANPTKSASSDSNSKKISLCYQTTDQFMWCTAPQYTRTNDCVVSFPTISRPRAFTNSILYQRRPLVDCIGRISLFSFQNERSVRLCVRARLYRWFFQHHGVCIKRTRGIDRPWSRVDNDYISRRRDGVAQVSRTRNNATF